MRKRNNNPPLIRKFVAKETTMLHSLEELNGLRWWVQKEEYGEKGRKWNNVENDVNM